MDSALVRYVIITPVRNERAHVDEAIRGVVAQTIPPVEWFIIDDGSTDGTASILDQWAAQHEWITVVHRLDRGFRASGTGVMEAFYDGYDRLRTRDWEFLVKLDGDIVIGATYFEACFTEFRGESSLGIGGGTVDHLKEGELQTEWHPRFHVRGATKIYRRKCWDAIGGLAKTTGWDTLDELHAQFLGWTTRTFENVRAMHRKPTGIADGAWRNAVKNGLANYVAAYHPVFMLIKCVKRLFQKPYIVQGVGLACGFLAGYVHRVPRTSNAELIAYIRRQQMRRLAFRSSIWQ